MKHKIHTEKLHELWRRISLLSLACLSLAGSLLLPGHEAEALYILTGASDTALVLDSSATAQKAEDYSSHLLYAGTSVGGFDLNVKKGLPVVIRHNGSISETKSKGESISSILQRSNCAPSPLEMVLVKISSEMIDLTVASDLTYYDRVVESVAYETIEVPSADLPLGKQEVIQEGVNGTRTAIYEVIYSGGELISRQLTAEESSTVVPKKVRVGTAVETVQVDSSDRIASVKSNADGSGSLTFASGSILRFKEAKSMTATAYTANVGKVGTRTATGTRVHVGTVAVDKRVIPLGTRMYIVTNDGSVVYGMAVAEDTGVRGNIVDLYYNTYRECINFGRRACTVYILE